MTHDQIEDYRLSIRMLIGFDVDLLSIVYGPGKKEHWNLLVNNPRELSKRNGLWEALMVTSDAVLVDSSTDSITDHGYLASHWGNEKLKIPNTSRIVEYPPKEITEQDVDTIVRTVF